MSCQRASELADDIARNTSSVGMHLMKDMIWRDPDNAQESHLLASKILVELFQGKDKLEGVESFLQREGQISQEPCQKKHPVLGLSGSLLRLLYWE
jgi:enoyl-CoA hydratase/carnithine racemase